MSKESRDPSSGTGLLDSLVQAERASTQPAPDAQRHTWERVAATVALRAPTPLEPSSIAGPTATLATPWVKIVLGVVLSTAVGVIAVARTTDSAPDPDPVATSPTRASVERRETPPAPTSQPPLLPPRARPSAPPQPAVALELPPSIPSDASPKTPHAAAPATVDPPTSDLTEETRLLAKARARLRAGSPGDALAPLAEHARRFPAGQLTEDRMVLRAQALCKTGDIQAGRAEAAALREVFPSSSHLPRVARVCRP